MDNIDVWPLSVESEALLACNFTSQLFKSFYKYVQKIMEIDPADC